MPLRREFFMHRAFIRFAPFIPMTAALVCMLATAAVLSGIYAADAVPSAKSCAGHQQQQKGKVTT
jgi:hypothetical protein